MKTAWQLLLVFGIVNTLAADPPGKESRKKAFTNQFDVDLFAGVSLSSLSLDNPSITKMDSRISPLGAIEVSMCKPGFGIQTGLSYLHFNYDVTTVSAENRKFDMSFLELPLMARYTFAQWFYVSGGFSAYLNLSSRSDFDFETGRPNQEAGMTKADIINVLPPTGKASVGFNLPMGLNIQVFFTKPLKEILKDGSDGKTFFAGGIQVGYRLTSRGCQNNIKQIPS